MTINAIGGLFLLFVAVGLTVRHVLGVMSARARAARLLTLAGMTVVCVMSLYEVGIGLDFGRYHDELLAFVIGVVMWVSGWLWASYRTWEIHQGFFGANGRVDSEAIAENPNWVRELVLGESSPARWDLLLPLVEAGWNGGFAWLTPELVREQISKTLDQPPHQKTLELPAPE